MVSWSDSFAKSELKLSILVKSSFINQYIKIQYFIVYLSRNLYSEV